jgi:hypothetical protein
VSMTFLSEESSSRRETMVDGTLTWVSSLRVGLGVGGEAVVSRLIDIWVDKWVREFRCGVSDFCFSFKNESRGTVPW